MTLFSKAASLAILAFLFATVSASPSNPVNYGRGVSFDPEFCGGFGGIQCPPPKQCYDDPRDECDPDLGHRDCAGICL
ncbi:hypothetical protein AJ78_04082 [Emergomyces pasteurianus Ep9510]|uniref:Uncharacterized protein n=1 Tax=Emergomyces pasteurianus Ep9510 TaxID=1447872 RepID=A0A1J9PGX2_9EURO|nr:hypothetical protein AJ78_04082 [Emergomyces pasteurianus Ep9510]